MIKHVNAVLSNLCDNYCANCVSQSNKFGVDQETELSIDALLMWCAKFTPGATIHIQGGEPTLLNDFAAKMQKILDAGHRIVIYSNAQNMTPELYALDASWICSWKRHKQNIAEFIKAVKPIPKERLLINSVYETAWWPKRDDDATAACEREGYKLQWIRSMVGFDDIKHEPHMGNPSDVFIIVGRLGEVYECSHGRPDNVVGDVYKMIFNPDPDWRCPTGRYQKGTCQACSCANYFEEQK